MPSRHVVFVNRFFYPDHSATSQILTDLAFDLAADEAFQVTVITSRLRYDDPDANLPPRERIGDVEVVRVWSTRLGRNRLALRALDYATFYLGAAYMLWRSIGPGTCVVAKTDPPLISVLVAPLVKLRGGTLINWLQDVFPEVANALGMGAARGLVLHILRAARNASLRAAIYNVVLGTRMKDLVQAQGISADTVRIIPNWADGRYIFPMARSQNVLRREWGLQDHFVVGYSGNLGRAHEFETILAAAEKLRSRSDIRFLFVGAGAQRHSLEREAAKRSLPNVSFQPYQPRERLGESLTAADVHLVSLNPALEGLIVPSKFYGVAAAGRPAIFIGDLDGELARTVREENCGYSIGIGDASTLAALILRLSEQPRLVELLGANARSAFDRRFDRSAAVTAWKKLLSCDLALTHETSD